MSSSRRAVLQAVRASVNPVTVPSTGNSAGRHLRSRASGSRLWRNRLHDADNEYHRPAAAPPLVWFLTSIHLQ
jgi:hypothetical protein